MQRLWGAGKVFGEEKDRIETEDIPQDQERRGALEKPGVLALLLDRAKGDGKSWKRLYVTLPEVKPHECSF